MKLAIVDLSGLCFMIWHASAAQEVNSMYEHVLATVRAHLGMFDRVAVCCDAPGKKFRHELSADYKANREAPEGMLLEQIRRLKETLEGEGCHVLEKPGFEADDLAASLVQWARTTGNFITVHLVASDKDWLQLVHDAEGDEETEVTQYRPHESKHYNRQAVLEKIGVPPEKLRDFLALCGDTSDNIAGVAGVGPKTAVKLLVAFGDLEGISLALENEATKFTPARATNLRESRDENGLVAGLARKLVTLATDALTPEECSVILTKKEPVDMTKNSGSWSDEDNLCPHGAAAEEHCADCHPQMGGPSTSVAVPEPAEATQIIDGELEEIAARDSEPQAAKSRPRPNGGTALAIRPQPFNLALEPMNGEHAWNIAKHVINSRLFGYGNQEAVLVTVMMGRSLGIDMMASLRGIHIIKGKPVMSGQLMLGLIHRSGLAKYFHIIESTDEIARYETHRHGEPKPVPMSFSIDDCHRAKLGLNKQGNWDEYSNWAKYPRTMLRWRCVAELGRAVYPDVLSNCYTEDEKDEIR